MQDSLQALTQLVVEFRDARDWKQFHKIKDMLLSLMLEVAELSEHAQWKDDQQFAEYLKSNKPAFAAELSDILYWVLIIANDTDINLAEAFKAKMLVNESKYPVDKARGRACKYTELV